MSKLFPDPPADSADGNMPKAVLSASMRLSMIFGTFAEGSILSRSVSSAGKLAQLVVRWWLGELSGMVPSRLADAWNGRGEPATVLVLTREEATLLFPARGRFKAAALAVPDIGETSSRARVVEEFQTRGLSGAVTIRLDSSLLHEAELILPSAAEPALGRIVGHQIERLVPLPAKDVIFDPRVIAHAPDGKSIKVRVVMAKRTTMERALHDARTAGLVPKLVIAGGDSGRGSVAALFWRAARGPVSGHPRLLRFLDALAIAMALAAYGLHVDRLDQVRSKLETEVADARQEAATAQAAARSLAQANEAVEFFTGRRRETPPLRIIDELTRLIPRESWISQLSVRGRAVDLTGFSPRATALIPRLEASILFEKAQFRSAITLTPDGRNERFSVSLTIRPDREVSQ